MENKLTIHCPSVIDLDKSKHIVGNCFLVDKDQPNSIHKAIETLGYYFKREFKFDLVQYSAINDKNSKNSQSYIWVDEDWDDTLCIGAANFRFLGDVHQHKDWSLQWVWFHPYFRRCDLLATTWPYFVEYYGEDFHCEPPFSPAFKAFLRKMEHSQYKWQTK